jgi:hypothetical protein
MSRGAGPASESVVLGYEPNELPHTLPCKIKWSGVLGTTRTFDLEGRRANNTPTPHNLWTCLLPFTAYSMTTIKNRFNLLRKGLSSHLMFWSY